MNTHEFVAKFQENQRKAEKNKRRGQGSPQARLANKQHSTNK
ncbi:MULTISPECIES: DUF4023 family protein [Paenibacillus]|uniref:DUF4023 domain-containing protein n=1 Tax=Paenibacillus typhae TaxID=1174501 RepID=A0A1G8XVX7_9BACL|nr:MULTISPECIES: DUF4023 family protein [Paenibacillus]MBY0011719.1 DUF4023 family protein [Paenibacillus typhae]SDJ94661.1 Protein of unknown function [Paenibacillus typhae]